MSKEKKKKVTEKVNKTVDKPIVEKAEKPKKETVVFQSRQSINQLVDLTGIAGSYTLNPLEYRFGEHTVSVGDKVVVEGDKITVITKAEQKQALIDLTQEVELKKEK